MSKIWNRKGKAIKNWRSRAWSIDPKKTRLTIIKTEETKPENPDIVNLDIADLISNLIFSLDEYPKLPEFCAQGIKGLTDIEEHY